MAVPSSVEPLSMKREREAMAPLSISRRSELTTRVASSMSDRRSDGYGVSVLALLQCEDAQEAAGGDKR